MAENLKYDPLHTFQTGNARADAIDNLLSVKIETSLECKIQVLMKKLIESEDDLIITQLVLEIKNQQIDIENIQKKQKIEEAGI